MEVLKSSLNVLVTIEDHSYITSMITHKSVCMSPNSIMLTLCLSSDDQGKNIRSFVKEFSETVGGLGQMAFVYSNKEHFEKVRNGLRMEDCQGKEKQEKLKTIETRIHNW